MGEGWVGDSLGPWAGKYVIGSSHIAASCFTLLVPRPTYAGFQVSVFLTRIFLCIKPTTLKLLSSHRPIKRSKFRIRVTPRLAALLAC